ncbi:Uncharacterised protein [Stenotrophomonas maltophilia]|nr:Uncharacterised protein [Stenotrophomonas maltophilia]
MTSATVASSSTSRMRSGGSIGSTGDSPGALVACRIQGSGSHTRKRAPLPGWLSTSMRPFMATASSWQIARPSPLPP